MTPYPAGGVRQQGQRETPPTRYPAWTGRELAEHLHIKPRNMLTQLAE